MKYGTCKFASSCQFLHPPVHAVSDKKPLWGEADNGVHRPGRTWQSVSAEGKAVSLHITRIPLSPSPAELSVLADSLSLNGALLPTGGGQPLDVKAGRGAAAQRGWVLVQLPSFEQGQKAIDSLDGRLELRSGCGPIRVKFAQLKRRKVPGSFRRASAIDGTAPHVLGPLTRTARPRCATSSDVPCSAAGLRTPLVSSYFEAAPGCLMLLEGKGSWHSNWSTSRR